MKPQPHEWTWLDSSEQMSAVDLSRACGISLEELEELVGYGAVRPLEPRAEDRRFSAGCVATLRHACKLRQDFDLDLFTVALIMDYLNRIEALQRELRYLHAQLPSHVLVPNREGPRPWVEQHAKAGASWPA